MAFTLIFKLLNLKVFNEAAKNRQFWQMRPNDHATNIFACMQISKLIVHTKG